MTDEEQLERFRQAVEDKNEEARARSEPGDVPTPHGSTIEGDQADLTDQGRPQDARDERAKSSGHGKKTADKWNQ